MASSPAMLDPSVSSLRIRVGTGTIENDDLASITIGDVSQVEGDGDLTSFVFTVSTSAAASEPLTVRVNTNDPDEAVEGTDFAAVTDQIVTIDAGKHRRKSWCRWLGEKACRAG